MSLFKTWIVDNVVGPVESIMLGERDSLKKRAARALELISNDITPQESIREIFRRFPEVFARNNVRQKLFERMHRYCYDETKSVDERAQEMFGDILCASPGAIPVLGELLWQTNALLFFRNKELYNRFNDDLGAMYKTLTDEQKVEFAPKVLKTHGILLEEIPKSRRTKQLCVIAIHCHGYALRYVPEEYQLEMVCTAYVTDGLQLRKEKWFEELFKQLTKKQQKECLTARKNKYRHWNQTIDLGF